MSLTRPSLFARRRRSEAAILGESGFVLVFVMLAGLILILTAISLVSRTTSGSTTAAQETRTQAARMAAETGFNEIMAKINNDYDTANPNTLITTLIGTQNTILGAPTTSYTILNFNLLSPPPDCDPTNDIGEDVNISILGRLTTGSNVYTQQITRTLRVCKPTTNPTKLRVRSYS